MLSICDVVLNHTANETAWLADHPEASYNCLNCPHLRPAALLDALLARLTADVARGDYEARGVPRRVTSHDHIEVGTVCSDCTLLFCLLYLTDALVAGYQATISDATFARSPSTRDVHVQRD